MRLCSEHFSASCLQHIEEFAADIPPALRHHFVEDPCPLVFEIPSRRGSRSPVKPSAA